MNGLIRSLEKIKSECEDPALKRLNQHHDENLDDFTRLKRQIAAKVREARFMIKDRDKLEAETPGTRHTVEASSNVRKLLKVTTLSL